MEASDRHRHGPVVIEGHPAVDAMLKQAWYAESVDPIPDDARCLLEEYSGLKPNEVTPHVTALVIRPFAQHFPLVPATINVFCINRLANRCS